MFAIQRNHVLSHAGAQDRFVQKAWNSVGLPRGTRGGSQIVELYGKHLTCSTSASGPTSATTEVYALSPMAPPTRHDTHSNACCIPRIPP